MALAGGTDCMLAGVTDGILAGVTDGILAVVTNGILAGATDGILAGVTDGILASVTDGILAGVTDGMLAGVTDVFESTQIINIMRRQMQGRTWKQISYIVWSDVIPSARKPMLFPGQKAKFSFTKTSFYVLKTSGTYHYRLALPAGVKLAMSDHTNINSYWCTCH